MSAICKRLEDGTAHVLDEPPAMRDRDQSVALAPEHGDGRERLHFVRPLQEMPRLAAKVDHVAYRTRERSRRAPHGVHRRERFDVLLTVLGEQPSERLARSERHEGLTVVLDEMREAP